MADRTGDRFPETTMAVLASPDGVGELAGELRLLSLHLQDVHRELLTRCRALEWEGGGVEQFDTQLGHADQGFTNCVVVLEEVVGLLGQAEEDLAQARNALVHAEDFVISGVAQHDGAPGAYFHSLGWTQYPVLPLRYSTEWEDLAIRAGYRP